MYKLICGVCCGGGELIFNVFFKTFAPFTIYVYSRWTVLWSCVWYYVFVVENYIIYYITYYCAYGFMRCISSCAGLQQEISPKMTFDACLLQMKSLTVFNFNILWSLFIHIKMICRNCIAKARARLLTDLRLFCQVTAKNEKKRIVSF